MPEAISRGALQHFRVHVHNYSAERDVLVDYDVDTASAWPRLRVYVWNRGKRPVRGLVLAVVLVGYSPTRASTIALPELEAGSVHIEEFELDPTCSYVHVTLLGGGRAGS